MQIAGEITRVQLPPLRMLNGGAEQPDTPE